MIGAMGKVSIRAERDAAGRRKYIVRWREGKKHRQVTVRRSADADALRRATEQRLLMEGAGLHDVMAQALLLEDLLQEYLKVQEASLRRHSYRDLASGLPRVLEELGRGRTVGELTIPLVIAARSRLKGSNRTKNKLVGHLQAMMRWAASQGRISRDPLAGFRRLPLRGHTVRNRYALKIAEVHALLEAARQLDAEPGTRGPVPQAPLYEVLIWCGLRISEAADLRWHDVRPDHLLVGRTAKSGLPRSVPAPAPVLATLKLLRERQGEWLGRLPTPEDRVFLTARKRPINPDSVTPILRRLRACLDMAKIEWRRREDGKVIDDHSLRHTAACLWRDAGRDMGTTAALLGHASMAMVKEVYGRDDRRPKDAASEVLDELAQQKVCAKRARLKGGEAKGNA